MLRQSLFFCACLLIAATSARAGALEDLKRDAATGLHRSLSGQFIIHDARPADAYVDIPANTNFVLLDPDLLTVSCERIKTAVLNELGAHDEWHGRIYIELHPGAVPDQPGVVAPVLSTDGWNYRLDLPQTMDRSRFISSMVEVILLEIANRNSQNSTQIPPWLAQGLSRQVMLSSKVELLLTPPKKTENDIFVSRRNTDLAISPANGLDTAAIRDQKLRSFIPTINPVAQVHDDLQGTPPLSLDQLSWPAAGQFNGRAGEIYRSSAQLFVVKLLQLPDGRQCLRALVPELGQHLNWQIAFLRAFHSDFPSQLALDKWWALQSVQFTGRDIEQNWPISESWNKLDEILRPSVEVRASTDNLPMRAQAILQNIIRDWPIDRQLPLLQSKANQLLVLRIRVSPNLVPIVDEYRLTLESYIADYDNATSATRDKTLQTQRFALLTRDTLRKLDTLDARREQLRPKPNSSPSVADSPPLNR